MKLRSGTVYDPSFPQRANEFMNFHNHRFTKIWVSSMQVFVNQYKNDSRNLRKAQSAFRNHVLSQVKRDIGYFA